MKCKVCSGRDRIADNNFVNAEPGLSIKCPACKDIEPINKEEHMSNVDNLKTHAPEVYNPPELFVGLGEQSEVEHPAHYTKHPVESIRIIELAVTEAFGVDGFKAYCFGTELKYRLRAGIKTEDPAKDIAKSAEYMKFREEK